ncbi:MAG: tetratricopeptide repeat protein [Bacteroidales bacterium]|nr:tetratricopeptide repeat protein [Bacteroidales bacterium]
MLLKTLKTTAKMRNLTLAYTALHILLLLLFLFLAPALPSYGQSNMDSLLNNVKNAPRATMIKSLSIKANDIKEDNPKAAIDYSIQAIELSKKENFAEGLIFNYRLLGNLYYHTHRYEDAIVSYDQCIEYALLQRDSVTIRECYLNKGAMFFTQGLNSKALDNYLLALNYSENLDKEMEYNNIGTVFFREGEYEEAYKYYHKSLKIMKAKGNQYGVSVANNNIGDVYRMTGNYAIALDYYMNALSISRSTDEEEVMIIYLANIGEIKAIMNDRDSAPLFTSKMRYSWQRNWIISC